MPPRLPTRLLLSSSTGRNVRIRLPPLPPRSDNLIAAHPAQFTMADPSKSITSSANSQPVAALAPEFSAGADIPRLMTELRALIQPDGHWALSPDARGLEHTFKFKTFKQTWVRPPPPGTMRQQSLDSVYRKFL